MPEDQALASVGPGDLAEVAARFGAALRRAGLPVGPGRSQRFAAAIAVVRPMTRNDLFNCALATLVSSREDASTLRTVFSDVFGAPDTLVPPVGLGGQSGVTGAAPASQLAEAAQVARGHVVGIADADGSDADDAGAEPEGGRPYLGSPAERLAGTDFAELSPSELAELALLMRQLTLAVPARRSRRRRRRPGGQRIDMRSTLRQARRTGGHAFRLIGEGPEKRRRRLVVLCDISGSMEPYARAMIQLLYCAAGGADAEVFTFATRLTRLTTALARSSPAVALARAAQAACLAKSRAHV